jgi:hypothetical protein
MKPKRLVIFDYSGTLSLGSVRFAAPGTLMKELEESGLAALGVGNIDFFWREIVAPTWEEGSTTGAGYARMIEKRLGELFPGRGGADGETARAAARFVESYLRHSAPDRRWEPLLRKLLTHQGTRTVVATDHYGEATAAILDHLGAWGLPAKTAMDAPGEETAPCIVVANSADIGYPKEDRRFWEILKKRGRLETVRRTLCVDDFGGNEGEGDRYGVPEKVKKREEQTRRVLESVFPGDVRILPFLLPSGNPSAPRSPEGHGEDPGWGPIPGTAKQIEDWLAA